MLSLPSQPGVAPPATQVQLAEQHLDSLAALSRSELRNSYNLGMAIEYLYFYVEELKARQSQPAGGVPET